MVNFMVIFYTCASVIAFALVLAIVSVLIDQND